MSDEKEKARQGELDGPEAETNDALDSSDLPDSNKEKKQENSQRVKPGFESGLRGLKHTMAYLNSKGATLRSMLTAVIAEEDEGYERIKATIRFQRTEDGGWEVKAPKHLMPEAETYSLIKAELASVKLPKWEEANGNFIKALLPERFRLLDDDAFYICRSPNRDKGLTLPANSRIGPETLHPIIMVQVRLEGPDGKIPLPLSYWDDGKWRVAEPARRLPAFGMEQLHDTKGKQVLFLHEGGKSARAGRRIAEAYDAWVERNSRLPEEKRKPPEGDAAHPWAFDLAGGIHLGWIGGALRPEGTNWGELEAAAKRAGITRIVIVADNDRPGRVALPQISKHLNMVVDHLLFTNAFPDAFDLADDFPAVKVEDAEGNVIERFIDTSMAECLQTGTFMTKLIPDPEGGKKMIPVLTEAAKGEWVYIPKQTLYVSVRHPGTMQYEKDQLNGTLRELSHSKNTADLIQGSSYAAGRPLKLDYDPSKKEGVISDSETLTLNVYRPGKVRAIAGSAEPFLQFLKYLFPDAEDRQQVERWCATLIAKPERRMIWGLLLITQKFGIGKNTFASILAELIGKHNVSFPGENDLLSDFNEWVCETRLVICSEIYAGHSWRAYNKMKSYVTEDDLTMNRKHLRSVKVKNWTHFIVCSNYRNALKIPNDDRRWLIPEMTEKNWPHENFVKLRAWLATGGLGKIKHWAENYGDYVLAGKKAPSSKTKDDIIRESLSEGAKAVARMAEKMAGETEPKAIIQKSIRPYAKAANGGQWVTDSDNELVDLVKKEGIVKFARIKIDGVNEVILVNKAAKLKLDEVAGDDPEKVKTDQNEMAKTDQNEMAREFVKKTKGPFEILPTM